MNSCRYHTERVLSWMLNNKLIVFLSLLSFCLFVSTLALSGQKGRLQDQLEQARQDLTSTTEAPTTEATEPPTEVTTEPPTEVTTDNPSETTDNPPETTPPVQPPVNPPEENPGGSEENPRTGGGGESETNPGPASLLNGDAAEEPSSGNRVLTQQSENDYVMKTSRLMKLLQSD